MLETRGGVAGVIRQGDPQLDAMELGHARRRHLRMADAATRGHEVELTGSDEGVVTGAVAMLDLAGEEPTRRLQSRMRMRCHLHPAGLRDTRRAVVVDEAPTADEGPFPPRKGPTDGHALVGAECDLARTDDLDRPHGRQRPGRCGWIAFAGTWPRRPAW